MIAESDYMTCIHQESGLCPECQADWEADPSAWIEYGNHPRGIANWQQTLDEIAEDAAGEFDNSLGTTN